jgi:hypothetical protein
VVAPSLGAFEPSLSFCALVTCLGELERGRGIVGVVIV